MIAAAAVVAIAGVVLLSHIVPFRFIQDWWHSGDSVWTVAAGQNEGALYLTYDDGPNPAATPELLAELQRLDVRATFFLIDDYVTEETAPLVRQMFDQGHCVAQHTGRRWLLLRSPGYLERMLRNAADRMERLTGRRPAPLFRPHAGWRSQLMFRGAARAGYKITGWSWRTWDWTGGRPRTGERVAAQVIAHAARGKIVVIHDGHHANPRADRRYAVEATGRIVPELRTRGFRFRTLCQDLLTPPNGRSAEPPSRP